MRHVALLRSINVNGHRMIRMEDLRAVVAELGHGEVRTFFQSGNVLFSAAGSPAADLAHGIEQRIAERFGLDDVTVIEARVRSSIARWAWPRAVGLGRGTGGIGDWDMPNRGPRVAPAMLGGRVAGSRAGGRDRGEAVRDGPA